MLAPAAASAQTPPDAPAAPEGPASPDAPALAPPATAPQALVPAEPAPAAPAAAPSVTPPEAPPVAAPIGPAPLEDVEVEVEPELPEKLAVGDSGYFVPGVLLQSWFLVENAEETTATFLIRRAEISAKGEIVPGLVGYAVMFDPARALDLSVGGDGEAVSVRSPMQDLFITLKSDYVDASFGQFKIPVSYEGYNSSSKLLFAERSAVSDAFGDRRDIGLRFAKEFEYVGYSAGIFNGTGQNRLDGNTGKDLALRLEVYPIEGLLIGGVVYATVGQRDEPGARDRYEADLRFERAGFLFQGEFIHARDVVGEDEAVEGNGFYAALAYSFLNGKLQPAVRVGYLDVDAGSDLTPAGADDDDEFVQIDVGLNYYIQGREAKFVLNYSRFEFQDKDALDQVILAGQVAY